MLQRLLVAGRSLGLGLGAWPLPRVRSTSSALVAAVALVGLVRLAGVADFLTLSETRW